MWDLLQNKNRICRQEDAGTCLSYGQVHLFGEKYADKTGGRCLIFILCSNTIGAVAGYIACLNHRLVPVLLSVHIDRELLNNLFVLYHPHFIWVPVEKAGDIQGQVVLEEYGYCLVETAYCETYPLHDDLALLLTTSGSTGSPKFVRQSYRNISANASSIRSFVAEKTGLHMRAFSVYAVREIPKSDAGKVLYGELELVSVLKEAAFKMMTFSGTTGSVFRK